jgi:hypothetical protein
VPSSRRANCASSVIHRRAETHHPNLITTGFPDAHARDAVAWFPRRLWAPFFPCRSTLVWSPWVRDSRTASFRQLHPLRSFVPPASPFTLTRVASSQRPILSWAYASLKYSPSTPRIFDPPEPPGSEHAPSPEGSGARLKGPRDPSSRVRPSRYQKQRDNLVSRFRPLEGRPAPPPRRRSNSLDLGTTGEPDAPGPRSLEVRGKRQNSAEKCLLL